MKDGEKVKIKVGGRWIDATIGSHESINEKFFKTKRRRYFQFEIEDIKL